MDNLTFGKIKEAIEKYTDIAIATRKDPTVDEMGAALSLYLSLNNSILAINLLMKAIISKEECLY